MYLLMVLFYTHQNISFKCILYIYLNGFYVLIIYIFIESISQQIYTDAWLKLKQLFFLIHKKPLNILKIHLDFNKTAHNAIIEVFENCLILGCRFHLNQAF